MGRPRKDNRQMICWECWEEKRREVYVSKHGNRCYSHARREVLRRQKEVSDES